MNFSDKPKSGPRHRAGDLAASPKRIYQQILAIKPRTRWRCIYLGVLSTHQRGELSEAIRYFEAATQSQPGYAEAHYNLGKALQDAERFVEAAEAYRQAAACRPGYARALDNLGVVLQKLGQLDAALLVRRRARKLNLPETHFNRGNAARAVDARCRRRSPHIASAVLQKPGYADALINLGNALQKMGQFDQAIQSLKLALKFRPQSATAVNALANALKETGRMDEAMECYRQGSCRAWRQSLGGGELSLFVCTSIAAWDARRIRVEHA